MKNSLKILLISLVSILSFTASAQTKEDKKKAKVVKANSEFIKTNKSQLLDGKHQTKSFFATSENVNSTKDLCSEFSVGNNNQLFINTVFEDEIQNYLINMLSEAGIRFKTFKAYAGGVKKVKVFDEMRRKFELFVDGKSVYKKDYSFSTSSKSLFISTSQGYEKDGANRSFYYWFLKNQDLFMKDCKIQGVNTYYLRKHNFITEAEKSFYKDKCEIISKTSVLNYVYDETKVTTYFTQVLAKSFNYLDIESKDKSLVAKGFKEYVKSKNSNTDKMEHLGSIAMDWHTVRYSHIDKIKGRLKWVLVFYKDKTTGIYNSVEFKIYQDYLSDNKYGEVQMSDGNETFTKGLSFLKQYNKQIGIFLKTNSLKSALN